MYKKIYILKTHTKVYFFFFKASVSALFSRQSSAVSVKLPKKVTNTCLLQKTRGRSFVSKSRHQLARCLKRSDSPIRLVRTVSFPTNTLKKR